MLTDFSHVGTWVFDLDNTLYPPSANLFGQMEPRMTDWVIRVTGTNREEADRIRDEYWSTHGTTLAGLMREHNIDPDRYLEDVHDIDLSHLTPDSLLADRIRRLPGRAIVYTNGSEPYARRVMTARGLDAVFEAVYGVEHAGYLPKPEEAAFRKVFERGGVTPEQAAMFDDDPRNLRVPHALGMRTILVSPGWMEGDYIHHRTDDLTVFLGRLLGEG